jgi:hypothetical protein
MVAIKLTKESKYIITTFVEQHTHAFVSRNKHLIRSNREVGEKVKNTLFNFHRASIGTSDAYGFLHVSLGGFENVGCTLEGPTELPREVKVLGKSISSSLPFLSRMRKFCCFRDLRCSRSFPLSSLMRIFFSAPQKSSPDPSKKGESTLPPIPPFFWREWREHVCPTAGTDLPRFGSLRCLSPRQPRRAPPLRALP